MVMAFLFSDQAQQGQFKMAADAYQSHRNERENATFCRFLQKKDSAVYKKINGLIKQNDGFITFVVVTKQYSTD